MTKRKSCLPQAHFLILRHEIAEALAEFSNHSADLCLYISPGEGGDSMEGLHLSDGDLMLEVKPWRGDLLKVSIVSARRLPRSRAGAMTPPCFQTVKTWDRSKTNIAGEAYAWGCDR